MRSRRGGAQPLASSLHPRHADHAMPPAAAPCGNRGPSRGVLATCRVSRPSASRFLAPGKSEASVCSHAISAAWRSGASSSGSRNSSRCSPYSTALTRSARGTGICRGRRQVRTDRQTDRQTEKRAA
eukprot:scaffold65059_cov65-Phaeocystis_antarctica.AAC.4